MEEIINFIKSCKREVNLIEIYNWCKEKNKMNELKEYQYLITKLLEEHNNWIKKIENSNDRKLKKIIEEDKIKRRLNIR